MNIDYIEAMSQLSKMEDEIREFISNKVHNFYYETGRHITGIDVKIQSIPTGLKDSEIYNVTKVTMYMKREAIKR
jgi:hypothetical protein